MVSSDGRAKVPASIIDLRASNAPAHDAPSVTFGSYADGKDLRWIQPRNGKPGGSKDGGVDENHRGGASTPGWRRVGTAGSGLESSSDETSTEEHGNPLSRRAPVERPSPTNAVQGEDADEGCEHVEDVVQPRDPLRLERSEAGNGKDCYILPLAYDTRFVRRGVELTWSEHGHAGDAGP